MFTNYTDHNIELLLTSPLSDDLKARIVENKRASDGKSLFIKFIRRQLNCAYDTTCSRHKLSTTKKKKLLELAKLLEKVVAISNSELYIL